jgi:hypothetical protein
VKEGGKDGMTLEDDVESMLSEQFNTSNESMFRVRGVGNLGQGGAGDSTYRCNDSMYDEDRGLISESEDGWYADKDKGDVNLDNKIDDISEHSSDECTDSDPEEPQEGQEVLPKKPKKTKGEKGEKKKKKKKKLEEQEQLAAEAAGPQALGSAQ